MRITHDRGGVDTTSTTTTTIVTTTTIAMPTTTFTVTTTTLPASGCGDPVGDGPLVVARADITTASDALFVLQAAVGGQACELCICDVNDSGTLTASDALAVLRAAVGQPVELACPPCT